MQRDGDDCTRHTGRDNQSDDDQRAELMATQERPRPPARDQPRAREERPYARSHNRCEREPSRDGGHAQDLITVPHVCKERARSPGAFLSPWFRQMRDHWPAPEREHSAKLRLVSAASFGIVLACGAALLAVWVDVRLSARRPEAPLRCVGHAAAAYAVVQLAAFAFSLVAGGSASTTLRLVALLIVFLPALVYAFLSGVWLMRMLAAVTRAVRR